MNQTYPALTRKKFFLRLLFFGAIVLIVAFFLAGIYRFEARREGIEILVKTFPLSLEKSGKRGDLITLANYFLARDGKERVFLILFQNNWELRPGGGFIGSFGVVNVKNAHIASFDIHDTTNFDKLVPRTIAPPYPLKEIFHVDYLRFSDSNFSPDFVTNAKMAEELYQLTQKEAHIDGVIAVTANLLPQILGITGPLTLPDYPGVYSQENAMYQLEYQVEKGYKEQGIKKGERKFIMNELAKAIIDKIWPFSIANVLSLEKLIQGGLEKKDIQLYMNDASLQEVIERNNWSGSMDETWGKDYLFIVDANLGAYKSDSVVTRRVAYAVNLSKEIPEATLSITYKNPAQKRDLFVTDYKTFLRVYVPKGSAFIKKEHGDEAITGEEFGKAYAGSIVDVALGQEKTVMFTYSLPPLTREHPYNLKIQKQAGVHGIPFTVELVNTDGAKERYAFTLDGDVLFNEL